MRFRLALGFLLLVGSSGAEVVGCSGAEEATPVANDDLGDPHVNDVPETFDDGLGNSLDQEPLDATPDTPDAGPASDGGSDAGADAGPAKLPTCDATASVGDYCGGDKVSSGSKDTLYHCTGPSTKATVVKVCASGCVVAPAGSDDYCKAVAETCPHVASTLKYGLHPIASDRFRCAGITAARITQTIGSAAASAGTHAQDGTVDGAPYSAATDLSVIGLTEAQVKTLIARLDTLGFAAFYRRPGYDGWPASEARHIHAVFAGARMKSSLRSQISDFLAGKNGLASHTAYTFYQAPAEVKAYIKMIFLAANS